MKPTEHKPQLENELIAHIRESLVEHEEPYVMGAWEKFNAPEKKRRPIAWLPFLQGAAALLVIGFIAILILNKKPVTQQIAKVEVDKKQPAIKEAIGAKEMINPKNSEIMEGKIDVNSLSNTNKTDGQADQSNPMVTAQPEPKLQNEPIIIANNTLDVSQRPAEKIVEAPVIKSNEETVAVNKVEAQKPNIIDFLENETQKNKIKDKEKIDANKKNKFTVGVVVAPSFGNVKKLNMGYGVSVDYNLTAKFSLNSGVAYNQMAATKGAQSGSMAADAPMSSALVRSGSSKNLESVEERVTGIDIPLEIKYHVNKHIYASFGVSAFAVIKQQRSNTYIEEKIVQQSSEAGLTSASQFSSMLVSERVTEKETPTKAEDYSYLGFYNLSFGYKKKISKNNSFAIEPFLKLPMKEVKTENLKLIGTGVKLKFDF